jgi:hypothetical protein
MGGAGISSRPGEDDLAGPDTTDPTLTWAILPTVDVTSAGETVTFSVGALDTGSGVDRVYLYFDHDWEGQSGLESVVALTDAADSFSDGQSAAPVYFDPETAAGTYSITTAIVYDKAGNWTQYSAADLAAIGSHELQRRQQHTGRFDQSNSDLGKSPERRCERWW